MNVTDSNGVKWQVNEDRVNGLINRHSFNYAFKAFSKIVKTKDHWLQMLYIAPEHSGVETDWPGLEKYKKIVADHNRKTFEETVEKDPERAWGYLAYWLQEVRQLECARNSMFSSSNSINAANVEWANKVVTGAEVTRDTSVMALGVIATVATAGTTFYVATAVSATGAGVGTYQDRRKAGESASVARSKAFGSAALNVVPIGVQRFSAGIKGVKGVVALTLAIDGSVELTKASAIDGAEADVALKRALSAVAFSGAFETVKAPVSNWLGRNLKGAGAVIDRSADGVRFHNRTPPLVNGVATNLIRTIAETDYGRRASQDAAKSRPLIVRSSSGVPANVCMPVSMNQMASEISKHYMRRLH